MIEMRSSIIGNEAGSENWDTGEESLEARKRFPAYKDLEPSKCDGDLGFVVGVAEFLGVFSMQFCGEIFVGMDLKG